MLKRGVVLLNRLGSSTTATGAARTSEHLRYQTSHTIRRLSTSENSEAMEVDLSNNENKRRLFNRLLYRSKQRGFLELDLVLGNWVEQHIHSMDVKGIKSLLYVLDQENPDLWKWLTGQEQAPESLCSNPVFSAVKEKVMNNLSAHARPETRADAGQPWVRGWDDFKKGRDAPIAGNQ